MKDERIGCEVPGCRRSTKSGGPQPEGYREWWLCPKHWALVPPSLRRVLSRHKRQYRKFGFYPREDAARRIVHMIFRAAGVF